MSLDVDDDVLALYEYVFDEEEVIVVENLALEQQVGLFGDPQEMIFCLLIFNGDVLDEAIYLSVFE